MNYTEFQSSRALLPHDLIQGFNIIKPTRIKTMKIRYGLGSKILKIQNIPI